MKTFFRIMVLGVFLSTVTTQCATTENARPVNKVSKIETHNYRVVMHKNVKYYRNNGVWYKKKNKKYVVVAAPVGARISMLPTGYKVVQVKNARYYRYKGVYYKRSGRNYIVVKV